MFLTKKVPEYEAFLKREYSEVYDPSKLKLEKLILEKKQKSEEKELAKRKEEEEKKARGIIIKNVKKPVEWDEEDSGINILRMALQQEELG